MSDPLRLVIWDLDGTLIDSAHMIVDTMERAAAKAGLPVPDPAAVRRIIGLSVPAAIEELFGILSEAEQLALVEGYKETFFNRRSQPGFLEPVFDGGYDTLSYFDSMGHLQGIATGKARRGVDHFIESHSLHRHFTTIQTADRHPGKPHPSMVLAALEETGVDPAQAVMIGDTSFDVEMAKSAGVRTVGVAWGNHPADELRNAGAVEIVDDFEALRHAVDAVFEKRKGRA